MPVNQLFPLKHSIAALLLHIPFFLCSQTIKNHRYTLRLNSDHSVTVETKGIPPQLLKGDFTVMSSDKDPGFARNHQNYFIAPRTAVRWNNYQQDTATLNRWLNDPLTREMTGATGHVTDDPKGKRIWTYFDKQGKEQYKVSGAYATGTTDPFIAGTQSVLYPVAAVIEGRKILFKYPDNPGFGFQASFELPEDSSDIVITHQLTANRNAWYSVAFTGTPLLAADQFIPVPQEAAGRQFKQYNHLVTEAYLRLPRIQLGTASWNAALVADPGEMPFRIPVNETSRFGLLLRQSVTGFQPISFAPVMGGQESRMIKGQTHQFRLHYALQTGNWKSMYQYVARHFYGFRDMRDNAGAGSINQAIIRTIDYIADRNGRNYAMWHGEQKYFDYWTDNSGIFKPFSPLYTLSASIITDDELLYRTRALPQVEFALSRNNNTFAPYEVAQNGQVKKRNRGLGSPYIGPAQLASLYHFFQQKTPAILDMANAKVFSDKKFADMLALYSITGNKSDLDKARRLADREISRKKISTQEEDYMNLLDLYEATDDKKHLDAAIEQAYALTTGINLSPMIPDSVMLMEKDNKVPVHEHSIGRHRLWGFPAPASLLRTEQKVPAWRVALTGLTSPAYRGEYWMNNHGQLMRLAALAKNDFLRDIARWGMIGRFGMYAGDNRSRYSLIAEDSAAVEHPIWQLNFATVNPGHATEFIGELLDFLISDAFHRSEGKINFPSRSMNETSFRVKVYGDRPGKFYNHENVRLWLPGDLLTCNNRQIDYVAGYDKEKFYIAFLNQSFQSEEVDVTLNPEKVIVHPGAKAIKWENNKIVSTTSFSGSKLNFTVPAKGITAFIIDKAEAQTTLQRKMLSGRPLSPGGSFTTINTPFGKVHAMILFPGSELSNAFVYTEALPDNIISARLHYRFNGGKWITQDDAIFPYEFSIPVKSNISSVEFMFEAEITNGTVEKSDIIKLSTGH